MPLEGVSNVAVTPTDEAPSSRPGLSRPAQLLLYVRFGIAENVYVVQPGITIGRSPDNAVCVDHCDVSAFHARVHRVDGQLVVSTTDPRWWLTLPSGNDTRSIELCDGVEFRIGEARFRLASARLMIVPPGADVKRVLPLPPAPPLSLPADDDEPGLDEAAIEEFLSKHQLSCPRCSEVLLLLPEIARFCPRCGTKLMVDESAQSAHVPRPATLVAYVNALLSLAHRFELGRDGDRNAAQALRYYRKAARLGNRLARFRLSMSERSQDARV